MYSRVAANILSIISTLLKTHTSYKIEPNALCIRLSFFAAER